MYHYIYKVVSESGKFYVGRHSTNDLDDGYVGSGKWVRSLKDKSTLVKTIIEFFDNEESLRKAEAKYIAEVIDNPLNMNFNENSVGFSSSLNPNKLPERKIILSKRVSGAANPMYGKNHSDEAKQKMSEATTRLKTGVPLSEQAKTNMSLARKGLKFSDEGREKLAESRRKQYLNGERVLPTMKGRKHTEESKRRMREVQQARPDVQCIHCGKCMKPQQHARWHGDRCKHAH